MDDSDTLAKDRIVTLVQRFLDSRQLRAVCSEDVLNEVGLTSLDAVRLVLLVEDEFELTIPTKEITRANFRIYFNDSRLISKLQN